jgi:signal peptidase
MQNEIPKNSFILVKHINPNDLVVGDNITYKRDQNMTVTHKIIEIYENHENSGARGFKTKGTNNANPDKEIVSAVNVVGIVSFSVPEVGAVIMYLENNLHVVIIIFGLCMLFSFSIRGLFMKKKVK